MLPLEQMTGWRDIDMMARLMAGEAPVDIAAPLHFTTSETMTTVEAQHEQDTDYKERFKKY